jgi:TolB-like protein
VEQRLPRKLAAILYADVAGYSRLTGEDEDATHRTLSEYLDFIAATIESNVGKVMHYAGDAVLAQFNAVLDALSSAVAIQSELDTRNQSLPDERKVRFRIGVNLGDVIEDRGDIYGDGVNIAARLEALAEPGGVCISDAVRTAIGNKLPFAYAFIGEQAVKNIEEPVRAYRVVGSGMFPATPGEADTSVAAVLWPLGKPSLAIKPFTNISTDPEQDYFADGLTMDIMTALVKIPELCLMEDLSPCMRTSKQMTAQELGRQLGVRYVLKGGVRKSGDRVRVNVELVEVATGRHLWAERFDREINDLFAIQDEITEEIVTAMDVKLVGGESSRFVRKSIKNPAARECLYRGEQALYGAATLAEVREAQHLYEEIIRLEPTSPFGYAVAAFAHWWEVSCGWSDAPERAEARALELSRQALSMEDTTGYPYLIMAEIHLRRQEYDQALAEASHACLTRPSCEGSYALKAGILNYLGRSPEAIDLAQYAVRLVPLQPPMYPAILASAYHGCGRYGEAIAAAKASIALNDNNIDPYLVLAAASAALGRAGDARRAAEHVLKLKPGFSLKEFAESQPYKDRKDLEALLGQLESAGLE